MSEFEPRKVRSRSGSILLSSRENQQWRYCDRAKFELKEQSKGKAEGSREARKQYPQVDAFTVQGPPCSSSKGIV